MSRLHAHYNGSDGWHAATPGTDTTGICAANQSGADTANMLARPLSSADTTGIGATT